MVTQSRAHAVPLLLTRPETQAADFSERLRVRFGGRLEIIHSPLLQPRFFAPPLPAGPFSALILTSQSGVEGYLRLHAARHLPKDVLCVGERTASAAHDAGLRPIAVAPDAASLILQIMEMRPTGRLLHLRGRDTRGNISELLQSAGIDTADAVVYAQEARRLSPSAKVALQCATPILVPLFSPRTAVLFVSELVRIQAVSPLFVAAMSGEVALEVGASGAQIKVSAKPDAAAMADTIAMLLTDLLHA